jgi:hypothetical protein
MRQRVVFAALLAVSSLLLTHPVSADTYGSTDISYDPSSNLLTIWADTYADYAEGEYYRAAVYCTVLDLDHGIIASGHAEDPGDFFQADVYLQATGAPGNLYNAVSHHSLLARFFGYIEAEGTYGYDDYYNFSSLAQEDIVWPDWYDFYGPGPEVAAQNEDVSLGYTEGALSLKCGTSVDDPTGERDQLIGEYSKYRIAYQPSCADFTQTRHSTHFTFANLNVNAVYHWALIKQPLTTSADYPYVGLDAWYENYGSGQINSAYRSPAHNAAVGGVAQSRHMYGDAVDMRNESRTTDEYWGRVDAAVRASCDYYEPLNLPCGLGCVHADWRDHDINQYQ